MSFVRASVKSAIAQTMNHICQNTIDWRLVPHAEIVNVSSGSSWLLHRVSIPSTQIHDRILLVWSSCTLIVPKFLLFFFLEESVVLAVWWFRLLEGTESRFFITLSWHTYSADTPSGTMVTQSLGQGSFSMTGMWKAGAEIDCLACVTETFYLASYVHKPQGYKNESKCKCHIFYILKTRLAPTI